MKQLFLTLILAALIAVGCGHATKTDSTGSDSVNQELKKMALSAPVGIVYKTLNGVDENVAKDWIKNYQTAITPPTSVKLKIVSYFLNKNMVTNIVRLLIAEAATTSKHKTDGIRIYFAKKSINDPETSLLLVSTIDSASTQYTHHDYYGHSNGFLFDPQQTDLSIKATDSLNNLGAVLYRPCPACPGIDTTCISVNTAGAILRSYAEKMVKNFDGSNMNTDAVWFPIGLFKSMSDEASFNGIRVYLATYPDDLYLNKGRNTFVLTTVNTTGKDYFYCDSNLKSFLKIHNTIVKYKGPPKNNGSLCPINCN